jgi:ubiquinone/menaquinone biosynthesis C-methylase UbiE
MADQFSSMAETTALDPVQRAAAEQFTRQSHRYGKGHILEDVSDLRAAMDHVVLAHGAKVLDVATGGGHTGLFFAALGHGVTLADISNAMLERASELAAQRGLKVGTQQHPAEAFPNADATFDLVACRVAPHHFSSPAKFVREAARVLKPGGWFLVIDGSIPDGQPEAEAWLHEVEKLRDPSHACFLSPAAWKDLCEAARLDVVHAGLTPRKQPDLEWYFATAATPEENRAQVRRLIADAPPSVRATFRLGEEDGRIVWWWPMVTLVARKNP